VRERAVNITEPRLYSPGISHSNRYTVHKHCHSSASLVCATCLLAVVGYVDTWQVIPRENGSREGPPECHESENHPYLMLWVCAHLGNIPGRGVKPRSPAGSVTKGEYQMLYFFLSLSSMHGSNQPKFGFELTVIYHYIHSLGLYPTSVWRT
jgi:hypothetical protein